MGLSLHLVPNEHTVIWPPIYSQQHIIGPHTWDCIFWFCIFPLDLFRLLPLIYIDLLNFIPASLPELRSYTKVLNHILTNSLVLIGFWTEPDLQYILNPTPICPSAINPDHYQIPSTMSPTPQHDISNWIAFQTQHMQIKLFILLPRWDFS